MEDVLTEESNTRMAKDVPRLTKSSHELSVKEEDAQDVLLNVRHKLLIYNSANK